MLLVPGGLVGMYGFGAPNGFGYLVVRSLERTGGDQTPPSPGSRSITVGRALYSQCCTADVEYGK